MTAKPGVAGEFHGHADFAVFIQGRQFNFSQDRYMEKEACGKPGQQHEESPAHLHAGVGTTAHMHDANATWGEFFGLLGMKLDESCFTADDDQSHCTNATHSLKFYANGKRIEGGFGDFQMRDLDKILVSYGSEAGGEVLAQLGAVTNDACVYSGKCPERAEETAGLPPEENCET